MLDLLETQRLIYKKPRMKRNIIKPADRRFIKPIEACVLCGTNMVHSIVNVTGRKPINVPIGCESKVCKNYIGNVFKSTSMENLIIKNQSDIK